MLFKTMSTIPFLNVEPLNNEETEQLVIALLLISGHRQTFFDAKHTIKL